VLNLFVPYAPEHFNQSRIYYPLLYWKNKGQRKPRRISVQAQMETKPTAGNLNTVSEMTESAGQFCGMVFGVVLVGSNGAVDKCFLR
jgi:hypothetical protein